MVGSETRVVGITTVDPKGYAPVSHTLCSLFGGGRPCTAVEFERLLRSEPILRHRSHLRVIVGGPGVWQLTEEDMASLGTDSVFVGEETVVEVIKAAVEGERLPRVIYGRQADAERIPPIVEPG